MSHDRIPPIQPLDLKSRNGLRDRTGPIRKLKAIITDSGSDRQPQLNGIAQPTDVRWRVGKLLTSPIRCGNPDMMARKSRIGNRPDLVRIQSIPFRGQYQIGY